MSPILGTILQLINIVYTQIPITFVMFIRRMMIIHQKMVEKRRKVKSERLEAKKKRGERRRRSVKMKAKRLAP